MISTPTITIYPGIDLSVATPLALFTASANSIDVVSVRVTIAATPYTLHATPVTLFGKTLNYYGSNPLPNWALA